MLLSPAQLAAHRAVWSGVHGNKRLPKLLVQDLLVEYFGSRGEVVTELQLAPDKDNMETWRAEWDITLVDAKVRSPADRLKTIGWLESKGGTSYFGPCWVWVPHSLRGRGQHMVG